MEKPDISDNTDKWDENLENMPGGGPDKPDRLDPSLNLSGLSGSPWGLLGENLSNMPKIEPDISDNTDKPDISDKPDRSGPNLNLSGPSQGDLNKTSVFSYEESFLLDDFEERLAIAEYDGHQNPIQAQRIAYQDAFIAVLNTLPYEEEQGYYDEDWLTRRIKAAQSWFVTQGLHQPE